jgi:hypothetical protein
LSKTSDEQHYLASLARAGTPLERQGNPPPNKKVRNSDPDSNSPLDIGIRILPLAFTTRTLVCLPLARFQRLLDLSKTSDEQHYLASLARAGTPNKKVRNSDPDSNSPLDIGIRILPLAFTTRTPLRHATLPPGW